MPARTMLNPTSTVTGDLFRHAVTRLPTGVAVLTTTGPDGPVGCTVNAVMSLSTRPPALLVSLNATSRTLHRILDTGSFAVNVLPWHARHLAGQFATGTPAQRFAGVDWRPRHGMPVLTGVCLAAVCEVSASTSMLDHTLVAGTVTWLRTGDHPATVLHAGTQHPLTA